MKCLTETQMSRYISGELSGDEVKNIMAHVSTCSKCNLLRSKFAEIEDHLKVDNRDYHSDLAVQKIMTIIDVDKADTVTVRRLPVNTASRLLAVAAILTTGIVIGVIWMSMMTQKRGVTETFQARSGGADDPDRWVSLQIFENKNGNYLEVEKTISPSSSLAFKYIDNSKKPFSYLMILAVDERKRVFWYYPSYLDEDANPKSISIKGKKGVFELPDEVSHKFNVGKIDIIGIFSEKPLYVQQIEQKMAEKMSKISLGQLDRLDLASTAQYIKTLRVEK